MTRSLASRVAQLERRTEAPRWQLVLIPDGFPLDAALRDQLNHHSGHASQQIVIWDEFPCYDPENSRT